MSLATFHVIQIINAFQWFTNCKTEKYLWYFFFKFSPFHYNENRRHAKVLLNNIFIVSRPITTN
jgi:hypothetical protein